MEGRLDDAPHERRGQPGLAAGAGGVLTEALETEEGEPPPPEADGIRSGGERFGNPLILPSVGGAKDDASAKDESVGCGTTPGPGLDLGALFRDEDEGRGDSHVLPKRRGAYYTIAHICYMALVEGSGLGGKAFKGLCCSMSPYRVSPPTSRLPAAGQRSDMTQCTTSSNPPSS